MSEESYNPQHSSVHVEHYTPLHVVELCRRTLGEIDLDPASSLRANQDIQAKYIFTEADDGYFRDHWRVDGKPSRVFLNPPGGLVDARGRVIRRVKGEYKAKGPTRKGFSSQKRWWGKLASEWVKGNVEAAIFVGFSIEILQSAQRMGVGYIDAPSPLRLPFCIPSERLKFDTVNCSTGARIVGPSPTHSNVIVWLPPSKWRSEREMSFRQLSALGAVVFPTDECVRG